MLKTRLLLLALTLTTMILPLLAQIDPGSAGQWLTLIIRNFGVPGALFLAFFFALHKGWIRLGREWEIPGAIREAYEARIKTIETVWNRDYDDMCKQYEDRIKQDHEMTGQMMTDHEKRSRERFDDYEKRLNQMREDRQRYLDIILRSAELGERMATAAEKMIDSKRRPDV